MRKLLLLIILVLPWTAMADDIFVESYHSTSRRWAILEANMNSAWLYLTEAGGPKPDKDAFVYSPIEPIEKLNIEEIKTKGAPPVLTKNIASKTAVIPNAKASEFEFMWSRDGESVAILYKGNPMAMIVTESKDGYSKSLLKESSFGKPWEQPIYEKYFK